MVDPDKGGKVAKKMGKTAPRGMEPRGFI